MKKVSITKRYYEPIPGETHKAWLAFCIYRDMGPWRSLDKAYREKTGRQGRHSRHWAKWSKKNHWVSRSQAYDIEMAKRQRRAMEAKRTEDYVENYGEYW